MPRTLVIGDIHGCYKAMCKLLEIVQPQPHDVFYDLGSGAGQAVLTLALLYPVAAAYGIELLPKLRALSQTQYVQLQQMLAGQHHQYYKKIDLYIDKMYTFL